MNFDFLILSLSRFIGKECFILRRKIFLGLKVSLLNIRIQDVEYIVIESDYNIQYQNKF